MNPSNVDINLVSPLNKSRSSSRVLGGHSDQVRAMAISKDGNRIVSCAHRCIRIWETDSALLLREIPVSKDRLYALDISPDGRRVIAGGMHKKIFVWDGQSGELLLTIEGHQYCIQSVAISGDGSKIVSGCEKSVRLWDANKGQVMRVLEDITTGLPAQSEFLTALSLVFSPDDTHVAIGGTDKLIKVWDILDDQRFAILTGHTDWVTSIAFFSHGKELLSGSWDTTVRIWNWMDGSCTRVLHGTQTGISAVAISPNGSLMASASKSEIIIWNRNGVIERLQGHAKDVKCFAFLPDGTGLMSGSEDTTLRIWRPGEQWADPDSKTSPQIVDSDESRLPLRPTLNQTDSTLTSQIEAAYTVKPSVSSQIPIPPAEEWSSFISFSRKFMGKYRKDTVEAYAHGGFSDVWKCHVLLVDNTIQAVALKELRAVNIPASKSDPASVYKRMIKRLEREILVWSRLQHPHIVPLVGFRFEPTCLISPWYSNGNLKDWVRRHPQAEKRKLTRQVVDGLMYLHSMSPPIVHGDIKSDNILMSDEGDAVINDFGLSQIMEDASESMNSTSTATIGNARWLAPEILCEGMKRSTASDVYSFGCLLLEIETGAMPFRGLPDIQVVVAVLSRKLPVSERDGYPELRENDTIWNMMLDCWNYDHYARPTMKIIEARL